MRLLKIRPLQYFERPFLKVSKFIKALPGEIREERLFVNVGNTLTLGFMVFTNLLGKNGILSNRNSGVKYFFGNYIGGVVMMNFD